MNCIDLIRRLHAHRIWVNRHLLEAVRPLSRQQLHQSFPVGQGSVWMTLTHLMAAEFVWLEALHGNETPLMPGDAPGRLPGNQQGEEPVETLAALVSRWGELDRRWKSYLDNLTDESLDELVYKVSTSSQTGERLGAQRSDILLHVCTHAQYTTAQLVNMLRQLGVNQFPATMLISMARKDTAD